ncbi:MAG: hypothetical protein ACLP9L_40240 [Thermoguttaceae bacterium]
MNRQLVLATVGVLGVLAVGTCILAAAAEPSTNNNPESEFAGKIVYVQMTTNESFVLENVNVKVVGRGGDLFLAGRGIKRSDLSSRHDWWEGLPVRLNLRSVVSYFPMTPEQWKNVNDK